MPECQCDYTLSKFTVGGFPDALSKLRINASFSTVGDNNGLYLVATQTQQGTMTLRGIRADLNYNGGFGSYVQGMNATDFTFIISSGTVGFAKSFNTWGIVRNNCTANQVRMIDIATPLREGNGTIGILYGLYLGNMNAGSTNWAIFSEGGPSYFGGSIQINAGPAPGARLTIGGGSVWVGGREAINASGQALYA